MACVPPPGINASNVTSTSAKINWTPVEGSYGYQLRYRVQGTTTWQALAIINGTLESWMLTGLQANTTYDVQMRTKCDITPNVFSTYGPVITFGTTMRLGEISEAGYALLYPNPTSGNVTLRLENGVSDSFKLSIYNTLGQLVYQRPDVSAEQVHLNLTFLNAGVYNLEVVSNTDKYTLRLVKD